MNFIRAFLIAILAITVSACAGQSVWAPDEQVEKRRYDSPEPAFIMLKTMINNRSGAGGHAALTINASQTVMYDPAGRWSHPLGPERNDVVFGMFPKLENNYDLWHARDTHHVVNQKLYVSEEIAEQIYQMALAAGPSLDSQCTLNISSLLLQVEGFQSLPRTYFPAKLMREFAKLPGVQTTKVYDTDKGKN